jgi:HPt (histidine-containing phosphotransfer) domain-containing protein
MQPQEFHEALVAFGETVSQLLDELHSLHRDQIGALLADQGQDIVRDARRIHGELAYLLGRLRGPLADQTSTSDGGPPPEGE